MNKAILLLIVLTFLFWPNFTCAEEINHSIVTVRVAQSQGTGFFINAQGLVLTNYHVTNGRNDIEIELADGRKSSAVYVFSDLNLDLILYQSELQNTPAAIIAPSSTEIVASDRVFSVGSPLGQSQFSSFGKIIDPIFKINGLEMIKADITLFRGSSGSPLFNESSQVIGVITLSVGQYDDRYAVAIALKDLLSFLIKSQMPFLTADLTSLKPQSTPFFSQRSWPERFLSHLLFWNIFLILLHLGFTIYNRRLQKNFREETLDDDDYNLPWDQE